MKRVSFSSVSAMSCTDSDSIDRLLALVAVSVKQEMVLQNKNVVEIHYISKFVVKY